MDKLVLSLVSLLCLVLAVRVVNSVDMISACKHTPYPDICASLAPNTNPLSSLDETPFGFRNLALQATLTRAEQAQRFVSTMEVSSQGNPASLAWTDCMELMEDSVIQLSRALSSKKLEDAQTWLSAVVANHETCRNGFMELNSSSILSSFPFMTDNFTKFLSNSLAINKDAAPVYRQTGGGRKLLSEGLPEWVSPTERKLLQSSAPKADLVVAKDGSGNYKTIAEALAAAAKMRSGTKRFVIYVKSGVYKENIEITKSMKNLMFTGDGIDSTIVTGSRNVKDGSTTFRSATVAVSGEGFIARDMTFENTAGPQKGQAVALRCGADLSIFYRCSFKGYQDTLYVYSQRQFYRDCDVYGTVDFIFGDAAAVLQNCNIYVRKPGGSTNTITAQSRSDPNENTGISIHSSRVTAASDLKPVQGSYKTYLGRPWRPYSRTVFMKCTLDSLINPAGWLEWNSKDDLSTLYYGEYMNSGGGAATGKRVNWPGFHVMSTTDATKFTVDNFLSGSSWIKSTGIPFIPGL
ncbi:probable pectinesterase/pectinesterase inhibitor 17 [Aristolochia californica]|uniref:probable pectinesterase/pectinesterase inhibitor 17 n=1 Tax=Aristolochia californica TaxID=171875 RepID=UPI0035DAF096